MSRQSVSETGAAAAAPVRGGRPARPPVADVARERRLGRLAGIAGLGTSLLTVAAIAVAATPATTARSASHDDRSLLLSLGLHSHEQLLAAVMRSLGVLLLAAVALYLFAVVRARNPAHSQLVPAIGLAAFLLLAVTTLVSYAEVHDVAREFVASGQRTVGRAESLLRAARGGGVLRAANAVSLVAAVVFGIWVSLASYEAMRVGILTRFLAMFGIGAGVTSAIGITAASASLFLGWLVSVSLLALGWWPGGRPPAWDEGRAVQPTQAG